jgi:hypothetical protein
MAKAFLIFFQNLAIVPHDKFSPERRNVQQKIYVSFLILALVQNFAQKNTTGLDSKFVA